MLIMSGVRLGLTRANTTGRPVRMVFDLESDRVVLEESASRVMLREKDDEESTGGGAEAATEAERKARAEAERILEGPRAPRASFKPVKQFGFDADDPAQGRELGNGVSFRQVQTEHDGQPRQEGRAYLYFWPGGGTERAAIQLKRSRRRRRHHGHRQPAHRPRSHRTRQGRICPSRVPTASTANARTTCEERRAASRCSRCWSPSRSWASA